MPHLAAKCWEILRNAKNAKKCWNGRKVKSDAGKFFPNAGNIYITITGRYSGNSILDRFINTGKLYNINKFYNIDVFSYNNSKRG